MIWTIETLDLLEDLLAQYDGTVFLVSHDRAFLDNVVTQVIAAEGDGRWKEYAGGYDDWLRARKAGAVVGSTVVPKASQVKVESVAPVGGAAKPVKLSWKEQRELEGLPDCIAGLESEQERIQARLKDPATYRDSADELPALNSRLQSLAAEIERAMQRWEELESRAGGK